MDYSTTLKSNDLQTPCFVINEDEITRLSTEIEVALKKRWKNGIVGYSFKTNNFPPLISFFKKKGFYAETVSSDEFALALEMGYVYENIIFNGPVKERASFEEAVLNGSIVNIDSQKELTWLETLGVEGNDSINIGLRVNFCLENYCPGESQCGAEDGRFGFSYENGELERAVAFLREKRITLKGLHLHCSSKTRSLNIYAAIARVASEIIDKFQLELEYVDIGGGYFGGMPGKPAFDDYFSVVRDVLAKYDDLNVIIEPGMAVVGAGVDYVATVADLKRTLNNRFAVLDGSRIHIDPIKRKSSYAFEIVNLGGASNASEGAKEGEKTILCGFTCMEDDRFFALQGQDVFVGDKVVFRKVGAYTMGLSPQFIEFYPPVYRVAGGKIEMVRKKVSAKDFVMINRGE